jgi:hypothetical protein
MRLTDARGARALGWSQRPEATAADDEAALAAASRDGQTWPLERIERRSRLFSGWGLWDF